MPPPLLQEQEIKTKKSLQQIRETVKDTVVIWEGRRNEFVRGFAGLFGTDGMVVSIQVDHVPQKPKLNMSLLIPQPTGQILLEQTSPFIEGSKCTQQS